MISFDIQISKVKLYIQWIRMSVGEIRELVQIILIFFFFHGCANVRFLLITTGNFLQDIYVSIDTRKFLSFYREN